MVPSTDHPHLTVLDLPALQPDEIEELLSAALGELSASDGAGPHFWATSEAWRGLVPLGGLGSVVVLENARFVVARAGQRCLVIPRQASSESNGDWIAALGRSSGTAPRLDETGAARQVDVSSSSFVQSPIPSDVTKATAGGSSAQLPIEAVHFELHSSLPPHVFETRVCAAYVLTLSRYVGDEAIALAFPEPAALNGTVPAAVIPAGQGSLARALLSACEAALDGSTVAHISSAIPRFAFEAVHRSGGLDTRFGPIVWWRPNQQRFDVTLRCFRLTDGVAAELWYDPCKLMGSEAEQIVESIEVAVQRLGENSESSLDEISVLSDSQTRRLDRCAGAARLDVPAGSVVDLFRAQVERTPDAVAVQALYESLTYRALESGAMAQAERLRAAGVVPGDRVLVAMPRSCAEIVAVMGVLMSGAAYVGVDVGQPEDALARMVTQCRPRAFIAGDTALAAKLRRLGGGSTVDGWRGDDPPVEISDDVRTARVDADAIAYVAFTSGSTGTPKGVEIPHRAVCDLAWQPSYLDLAAARRVLRFAPLAFDASTLELFVPLLNGLTIRICPQTDGEVDELAGLLRNGMVDTAWLTSGLFRVMVEHHLDAFDGVTQLLTGGDVVPAGSVRKVLARNPSLVVINGYGPTENTTFSTTYRVPAGGVPDMLPIGRPIDGTIAFVLDPAGHRVPPGAVGELCVGGAGLASGYFDASDRTSERFGPWRRGDAQRLYRTGDLVRLDADDNLQFLGRNDRQVKIRGHRVEPDAVQAVLAEAEGVLDAYVAVVQHGESGRQLLAAITCDDPEALVRARSLSAAKLATYEIPAMWVALQPGEMPLTATGKPDAQAMLALAGRRTVSTPYEPPSSPTQAALANMWASVLGVASVGIHDDWFDLGGDSLAAVEMIVRASDELGVELPLGALAQRPTVAELAQLVDADGQGVRWRSLVPLRSTGSRTPLFVVHGGSGNIATFPTLVRSLPPDQPVYGLQWDGLDGSRGSRTVTRMAQHYLAEIRDVQPHGPYLLAGQCVGGLVAREMARLLLKQGERVHLLVMYDSPHLGSPAYIPGRKPSITDLLTVRRNRRARVRVAVSVWLRRRIRPEDRTLHGDMAMTAAGWKHRPAPLPSSVRVLWLGTGLCDGKRLGLSGTWDDGAMGWRHLESSNFELHFFDAGHNDVMYHPDSVAVLRAALEQATDLLVQPM